MAQPLQMLRGSLITFRRKCGNKRCRCAAGELHETPALSYSEGGRTKMVMLGAADVAEVKGALARYNKAKADLMRQGDKGIERLTKRIAADKARARRRR